MRFFLKKNEEKFGGIKKYCYLCTRLKEITIKLANMVDVVQLVRASDCGSECRGFESHLPPIKNPASLLTSRIFLVSVIFILFQSVGITGCFQSIALASFLNVDILNDGVLYEFAIECHLLVCASDVLEGEIS